MSYNFTLPAGKYIVGDPCYILREEKLDGFDWIADFCDHLDEDELFHVVKVKGHTVVAMNTAWGDGAYMGTNGREHGVDAGMIGIIPEELVSWDSMDATYQKECSRVAYEDSFLCVRRDDGTLHFGSQLFIMTDDDRDDEDYEDDWEEDDDYDYDEGEEED